MEKTLQYAINEALETGRRSAMPVFLEKELREKIAQQIESLKDGIEPKNEQIAKYAPVTSDEIVWRAAQIARGLL